MNTDTRGDLVTHFQPYNWQLWATLEPARPVHASGAFRMLDSFTSLYQKVGARGRVGWLAVAESRSRYGNPARTHLHAVFTSHKESLDPHIAELAWADINHISSVGVLARVDRYDPSRGRDALAYMLKHTHNDPTSWQVSHNLSRFAKES
jgi:hypothetical protein